MMRTLKIRNQRPTKQTNNDNQARQEALNKRRIKEASVKGGENTELLLALKETKIINTRKQFFVYCTRDQKKRKSASELPTPFDSRVRRGKALSSVTLAVPVG